MSVPTPNRWIPRPPLCQECRDQEYLLQQRSRKCSHCGRRRQCHINLEGKLTCGRCHSQGVADRERLYRLANTHALQTVTMEFDTDGTPDRISISTFCNWRADGDIDMVDGHAVYLLSQPRPTPVMYDPANASCESCRRNGTRELEMRRINGDREAARQRQKDENSAQAHTPKH